MEHFIYIPELILTTIDAGPKSNGDFTRMIFTMSKAL